MSTVLRQSGRLPRIWLRPLATLARDNVDLEFQDHQAAFRSKTNAELLRGCLVFSVCAVPAIVAKNKSIMKWTNAVLGDKLFKAAMKASFYGHFVAGEDQEEVKAVIARMNSFGVKAILDYSAEEDLSEEEAKAMELAYQPHQSFLDRRKGVIGARTFFYRGEAQCEKNMEIFLDSIDAVAYSTQGTGFAAIKLTALGRPQLLLKLSETIAKTRCYVREVVGMTPDSGTPIMKLDVDPQDFEKKLEEMSPVKPDVVREFAQHMTYDQKGLIHLFSWGGLLNDDVLLLDAFKVPSLESGKMVPLIGSLTNDEEQMFSNMMTRLRTVFEYAKERDVRVMVDAEQTYFQPAISRLTVEMMRKYNTEKAIVFNTYQCYLKDSYDNLVFDLEQARRQNFYFGAKLVRGAYMDQERARAKALGYEDPINPSYEATNQMYHKCLLEVVKRAKEFKMTLKGKPNRVAIMVASHNEESIRFAVQQMKEFDILPSDKIVCFGQLYGMCDQVSFPLGQGGYSVYKYVPYGPILEVLPYLSRRAEENKGVLSKAQKERRMLLKELFRRILTGQWWYTPEGNYKPA
ncbi:unnamed protein product [Notodromas monacha]|uniref:Proline dehydrogenase n=1 Tax=Notodromas monacha TaxID=399045 RepID=A0A7R9BL11_9CRUS|nr:unnamed protein product [Notodromas monacha]CAG0915950.1 unnamed protein product [Notodromas monacha]